MKRFVMTIRANQFIEWKMPPEIWLYDQVYRQVKKLTCAEVDGQCILCARHSCMWQQLVLEEKWPLFINEHVSLFKRQALEGDEWHVSIRLLERGAKWSHLFHFALQVLADKWQALTIVDWHEEHVEPTWTTSATLRTPAVPCDEATECARYEALTGEPLHIATVERLKTVQMDLPRLTSGRHGRYGELVTVTLTKPQRIHDIGWGANYYLGMGQFKRCD